MSTVKKNLKKTSKASRSGNQMDSSKVSTTVSRVISKTTIPKPYMSITAPRKAAQHLITRVQGLEVIAELSSQSVVLSSGFTYGLNTVLNPADPAIFTRLSSIANPYDRFRLIRAIVRYHPGCPSTTLGSIGIAMMMDPNDELPLSMVDLAQYESSAVGTVSEPLAFRFVSDKNQPFLLTATGNVAFPRVSDDSNPWYALSRLIIALDRVPAGTFLGYVSVEFEYELEGLKSAKRQFVTSFLYNYGLSALASAPASTAVKYDDWAGYWQLLTQAAGKWSEWNQGASVFNSPPNAYSLTAAGKIIVDGIRYFGSLISSDENRRQSIESAIVIESDEKKEQQPMDVVENPATELEPVNWVNPDFRTPGIDYTVPPFTNTNPAQRVAATGDVTMYLVGQDLGNVDANCVVLWTATINSSSSFGFTFDIPVTIPSRYRLAMYESCLGSRNTGSDGFMNVVQRPE